MNVFVNGCLGLCAILAVTARAEGRPTVTFDGRPLKVDQMRVSAMPFNRRWPGHQRSKDQTKFAYFASFDTACGGVLEVSGERRKISGPGKYTFEINGGETQLHVFADPPWRYSKKEGDLYFGPGEHFPGVIAPKDGQTVVLDRGAIVHGTIFLYKSRNVRITGRGILDLSTLERADPESAIYKYVSSLPLPANELTSNESDPAMSCTAFVAYGVRDVTVEGIVIRDSPRWAMQIRNDSRRVTVDDVKILGSWRYNSDGIDMCSSSEINVRNAFVRTYDDALVVRGPLLTAERADCRDILIEDTVTWNDWGCTLCVAQQGRPSVIEGVTMRRCRAEYVSSLLASVHVTMGSTNSVIRDVLLEDVEVRNSPTRLEPQYQRTDDDRFVPRPKKDLLLVVVGSRQLGRWTGNQKVAQVDDPSWFRFDFDNLVFRNLQVIGGGAQPAAELFTRVPNHRVRNVVLEGLPDNLALSRSGNVEVLDSPPSDANCPVVAGMGKVGFRLELGKPCFLTSVRTVTPREMKTLSVSHESSGRVTLVWKGHRLLGDGFVVSGTLSPCGKSRDASLRCEGNASSYEIRHTAFPVAQE